MITKLDELKGFITRSIDLAVEGSERSEAFKAVLCFIEDVVENTSNSDKTCGSWQKKVTALRNLAEQLDTDIEELLDGLIGWAISDEDAGDIKRILR